MLPARLNAIRTFLSEMGYRSEQQRELLNELTVISGLLDEAAVVRNSIAETLDHLTRRGHTQMWGGDPGKCQVCGR
jgi:hypothetical protein